MQFKWEMIKKKQVKLCFKYMQITELSGSESINRQYCIKKCNVLYWTL